MYHFNEKRQYPWCYVIVWNKEVYSINEQQHFIKEPSENIENNRGSEACLRELVLNTGFSYWKLD